MNPLLAVLLGWLALGLETSLKGFLSIRAGSVEGAPSFVIPVAAMIAICAAPGAALWAAFLLGLACDLTAPVTTTTGATIYHIGPGAIGMTLGAQFVILVRGMVIRRSAVTLVVMSVGMGVLLAIVSVAIITFRQMILRDPIEWSATSELGQRLLGAVLSGGSALVLAAVLLPLSPLLGLPASQAHLRTRR
ncbi:MAG: hypothetical protein KF678_14110 [Phycisphaeraceae bacterium]|nr:hypothetical protein [Phycisphaeraceae bacterium]